MASQNGFNGATALPLSCGKYVGFFSPRTLLAETPLADWAERIRTSKRQFDEVLGTSTEFGCTAEAIRSTVGTQRHFAGQSLVAKLQFPKCESRDSVRIGSDRFDA